MLGAQEGLGIGFEAVELPMAASLRVYLQLSPGGSAASVRTCTLVWMRDEG